MTKDENNALIRLADAAAGFMRDITDGQSGKLKELFTKADEIFDFARDAAEEFNNGGLEKKKEILSKLGSNLILKDKILTINLEETLIPMKEAAAAAEATKIEEMLEPVEEIDKTSQLDALYSQNPKVLALVDYVGTYYKNQMYAYAN